MNNKLFRETVALSVRQYGIKDFNPEAHLPVSFLPAHLKELIWQYATPKPKVCYRNVLQAIDFLRNGINNTETMGYVVGYLNVSTVPVEHCLLQIGKNYYDPTLEHLGHPVSDMDFIPVRTISEAYAIDLFYKYNHPPCLVDILRLERDRRKSA